MQNALIRPREYESPETLWYSEIQALHGMNAQDNPGAAYPPAMLGFQQTSSHGERLGAGIKMSAADELEQQRKEFHAGKDNVSQFI